MTWPCFAIYKERPLTTIVSGKVNSCVEASLASRATVHSFAERVSAALKSKGSLRNDIHRRSTGSSSSSLTAATGAPAATGAQHTASWCCEELLALLSATKKPGAGASQTKKRGTASARGIACGTPSAGAGVVILVLPRWKASDGRRTTGYLLVSPQTLSSRGGCSDPNTLSTKARASSGSLSKATLKTIECNNLYFEEPLEYGIY